MKKIVIKKIVTTAMLAVIGLFSFVAMKFPRENVPEVGIFNGPPPTIEPCIGCPGQTAYTIQNNSKCSTFLKFVIGFEAQQGPITTDVFTFEYLPPALQGTINILNSEINTKVGGMGIDVSQTYILPKGGIDFFYHDEESGINSRIDNLKPGESKTIRYIPGSNKVCECYHVSWNEATKTITIDDCE